MDATDLEANSLNKQPPLVIAVIFIKNWKCGDLTLDCSISDGWTEATKKLTFFFVVEDEARKNFIF